MNNDKFFTERCRVIVSKELNVPPDDVDMEAIFQCVENGIIKQIVQGEESCLISPKTKREKDAIWSTNGSVILDKIFNEEHPFQDFVTNIKNGQRIYKRCQND